MYAEYQVACHICIMYIELTDVIKQEKEKNLDTLVYSGL